MTAPLGFALRWLEATGGLSEPTAEGHCVVVPGALPPGFSRLDRVTGEPAVAREDPDAELVAPGSALFEAMLDEAKGAGRSGRAWLVGVPHALPSDALRALRVAGAGVRVLRARPHEHGTAVFTFHVVYASDERVEEVFDVGIDLHAGRIARRAADAALAADWSPRRIEALPLADRVPVETAYEIARRELAARASASVGARRAELDRLARAERDRTARYYDELARETEEESTADAATIAAKVAAVRRQRDALLAELSDKYALRVSARLATLLLLERPKLHVALELDVGSGLPLRTTVVYDPLLRALEPPDCPACARPSFEVAVAGDRQGARLVCAACAAGRASPSACAPR